MGADSPSGWLGEEVKNHTAIHVHNHRELATKTGREATCLDF